MEYARLKQEKKRLDDEIEKARIKEGKQLLKKIIKEYKLPASYLTELAKRVHSKPSIYS